LHHEIIAFITKAREQGAFVIYDPNFRRPHLADLEQLKPWMLENIRHADMVRGSNEDFELIFGAGNIDQAFSQVTANGCNVLIYTKNKDGVEAIFENKRFNIEVMDIEPVSTIGAGDAFNAGLIYGLRTRSTCKDSMMDAENLLRLAARFSTDVCLHVENYISEEFAADLTNEFCSL
jgi:fructokinase